MRTLLTLSPHLDDAAFSVSPLLVDMSATHRVIVATPFAGTVAKPTGFALACQLDKGLAPEVDYMKLRRGEDAEWAKKIGAEVRHGELKEAPHRGYDSAAELFSGINASDPIGPELHTWLCETVAALSPDLILLPLGIGGHVDHLWLRQVTEAALPGLTPVAYYCDQPYSAKMGLTPTDPSLEETRDHEIFWLSPRASTLSCALDAVEAYQSQIPFQFGTSEKMRNLLQSAWANTFCLFSANSTTRYIQETFLPAFH